MNSEIGKHHLVFEFPEYKDKIHQLKTGNTHFAKLLDAYHAVNHEVAGIESAGGNTSDEYLEERKKERLHLKDQLYHMLTSA